MKFFLYFSLFFGFPCLGQEQLLLNNGKWSFPYHRNAQITNEGILFTLSEAHEDDVVYHNYKHINYLQGHLEKELSPDSSYYFEAEMKCVFKMQQTGKSIEFTGTANTNDTSHVHKLVASNNLGLVVLEKEIVSNRVQDMPYLHGVVPDLNICSVISEDSQWQKVSGIFRPKVKGSYLLLGNFYSTDQTEFSMKEKDREVYYIPSKQLYLKDERRAKYLIKNVSIRSVQKGDLNQNCLKVADKSHDVFFSYSESSLPVFQRKKVETFLNRYRDSSHVDFVLLGYTDTIGSFLSNKKLAYDRASYIKMLVDSLGLKAECYVYGVGEFVGEKHKLGQRKVTIKPVERENLRSASVYTPLPKSDDSKVVNGQSLGPMDVLGCLNDFPYERIRDKINKGYVFENAKKNILNKSKDADIVFFGESHSMPGHRLFVLNLLKELKQQGFETLFVETIKKDFPEGRKKTKISDGYFSREPMFGNLLNEALRLGFQIKSYDPIEEELLAFKKELNQIHFFEKKSEEGTYMNPDGTWVSLDDGIRDYSIRNYGEAVNILIKSEGKVVVFGGESHNHFLKCGNQTTAGYWLKKLSNKTLLSVSQSSYFPDSLSGIAEPAVLVKDRDVMGAESFCPDSNVFLHSSDIAVFHPFCGKMNNIKRETSSAFVIEKINVSTFSVLVSIYEVGDAPKDVVPVLNQIVSSKEELKSTIFYLEKSDYFALIRSIDGTVFRVGLKLMRE